MILLLLGNNDNNSLEWGRKELNNSPCHVLPPHFHLKYLFSQQQQSVQEEYSAIVRIESLESRWSTVDGKGPVWFDGDVRNEPFVEHIANIWTREYISQTKCKFCRSIDTLFTRVCLLHPPTSVVLPTTTTQRQSCTSHSACLSFSRLSLSGQCKYYMDEKAE